MKVTKLAALLGGVVAAAADEVGVHAERNERRALSDIATTVLLVTSTFTVTKCATNAINCPASATVLQTSTTVISVTTTICSLSETPGAPPPYSEVLPSSVESTAVLPTAPGTISILPPTPTASISLPVDTSVWASISIIPGSSINAVPSTALTQPAPSISTPDSVTSLSSVFVTASLSPTSASTPLNTNTDSVPTSFPVSSVLTPTASSSGYAYEPSRSVPRDTTAAPVQPTSTANSETVSASSAPNDTTAAPVQSTSSAEATSATDATSVGTPTSSGYAPPTSSGYAQPPPAESSSSEVDSTIRVTSYRTWTSFVTLRPSSSKPNTDTNTNAAPTSLPSSVSSYPSASHPSASGYPHPSSTGNATFVSPKPTYTELPTNMGGVVGAGKSSLVAMVIALAFAHFA